MKRVAIVAHRGWWRVDEEKNTRVAFARARDGGFGIETDFRDADGRLVVEHDLPVTSRPALFPEAALAGFDPHPSRPLAVNIKADGLAPLLRRQFGTWPKEAWFCFDASIPDAIHLAKQGLPYFHRLSEFEPWSPLHDTGDGIWLDQFNKTWFATDDLVAIQRKKDRICLVSPELHKRPREDFWRFLRAHLKVYSKISWMICTDLPDEADAYFNAN